MKSHAISPILCERIEAALGASVVSARMRVSWFGRVVSARIVYERGHELGTLQFRRVFTHRATDAEKRDCWFRLLEMAVVKETERR